MAGRQKRKARPKASESPPDWHFSLYVAGSAPKSIAAYNAIREICECRLSGNYKLKVIYLSKSPHLAKKAQIVALPTLVREQPQPLRRIVGDLSQLEKVVRGLALEPLGGSGQPSNPPETPGKAPIT